MPVEGSVAALLPTVDWSSTSLGPAESWPQSLRTALSICLDSRFPIAIFWGPELVQFYNDAFAETILRERHPALGQCARDCWTDIWPAIEPLLSRATDDGLATYAEDLHLPTLTDGMLEDRYFTFSYSPIRTEQGIGGVFCAVTETTARILREREVSERAEALAKLDHAKTSFFNNISHEFRTPLTLMLGPLEELLKTAGEAQRPLVKSAHRNSLRLLKLVNTLLQFSRLEAGHAEPSFVETDLAAMTADLASVFRPAIERTGLSLRVDLSLREPGYVDRSMWERIVLNLLANALKFTLDGEIAVSLRSVDGMAELAVADTGVGIPEAEVPHLFERFHRVRNAAGRSHEGSGIGLALVHELVRLHGGTLAVRSELGKGSTFTVRIPLGVAHLDSAYPHRGEGLVSVSHIAEYVADIEATLGPASHTFRGSTQPSGSMATKPRVLFADDNRDLREYVAHVLAPEYDVVSVANGMEALSTARSQAFDLILADVMMPEMDGIELLHAVRGDERLCALPVILLSARAGSESSIAGLDQGADDYLIKPFSNDELLSRIRAHVVAARRQAGAVERETLGRWFERPGESAAAQAVFRQFADQLPIIVFQQDPSGSVSFYNKVFYETLNQPRERAAQTIESWPEIIHPDDLERTIGISTAAVVKQTAYEFEYRLHPRGAGDDAYRWYRTRGLPQYDNEDEFVGWIGSCVDVHDARTQVEHEQKLRVAATRGERDFRALADTVPVMMWTGDATGWIGWYNQRWYEYTGQKPEDAMGWGWQAVNHTEDLPHVMEAWPRSIASGEPFEMEFRLRRHDGVYRSFLTRAVPLRDDDGEIRLWYGSSVDVEAQREALDRTKRIAEALQGVFLPAPFPVTPQFRIDAVYQAAEEGILVGGDWYEALRLPDGRFLLSVGDVTGHGLEAAVVAGRLRQAIVDYSIDVDDPAEALRRANRIARLQHPGTYATALVAFVDPECTTMWYACAGHPPPLVVTGPNAPIQELLCGGFPLGVTDEIEFTSHCHKIVRDAVLVLYTDGVTEFSRDVGEGEARLRAAAASVWGRTDLATPAKTIRDAVLRGNKTTDDAIVLVVQFSSVSEATETSPQDLEKTWRFHSSDARAASECRADVRRFLDASAADPDDVSGAETIVGELLANTVLHAASLVEVTVDWRGDKPILTITDEGPGITEVSTPPGPIEESGRGLLIVRSFADSVTIAPHSERGGARFEVVLPLRRNSAIGSSSEDP